MSGVSWKEKVAQQREEAEPLIQIPADATLSQLSAMLAEFGSNAANGEMRVRIAEAEYLAKKAHADEWLLLVTSQYEGKMTETAKRAQALESAPNLRAAFHEARGAEYHLLHERGIRDRWKMAFEAVSRMVTVKQMEHDIDRRVS